MRTVLIICFAIMASAALAQTSGNSYTRISEGPDILSLEETARSYFTEVVEYQARHPAKDDPFHPRNMLRDRDGLNPSEAEEVIAVARQLNAPKSPQEQHAAEERMKVNRRAWCESLNQAKTPDELLAVLEAGEANTVKKAEEKGKTLLDQLSPATRARVMQVLVEYRKGIAVGRQDWKKVREVTPEAMEMYRAHACTNVE